MQILRILGEFDDYRAYVSHTLCKHRLFLGLQTQEGAIGRLSDAAVWPLVRNESLRLFDLAPTLFGIVSPGLESAFGLPVRRALGELEGHRKALLEGEDGAFSPLQAAANQLRNGLASVGDYLQKNPPDFSEDAVKQYLAGRTREMCFGELALLLQGSVREALLPITTGASVVAGGYAAFWSACSDAYLGCRVAIVASGAAGAPKEADTPVRETSRSLQTIERIVSCYSPGLSPSERSEALKSALDALGFSDPKDILSLLDRAIDRLSRA